MTASISPKATDSLETWLSYLEQSHFKPIDMGLERIRLVAEKLDLLKPAPYVITVAGTNGKGSTCKLIETALLNAGLRVGVYSSPHLIHYNERVRIQGQAVENRDVIATFDYIEQHKTASLTYFEFGTLAAFDLFRKANLDVAILEVGLGGRLDATNIVDPNLAVITSIDIDHVEFLGDNREDIGREKAGIFRANIPVIIGEPDCPESILIKAQELNCNVLRRGKDWEISVENDRLQWQLFGQKQHFPLPQIPIPNVGTALAALSQVPFALGEPQLQKAVAEAQMLGRFQRLQAVDFVRFSANPPAATIYIDVGHNPHAARYLAERLRALKPKYQKISALFSALVDKDLSGIVEPLEGLIDQWHCAGLSGYRGQSGQQVAEKLKARLPNAAIAINESVVQAAEKLFSNTQADEMILVFGSFHTVADFLLWLNDKSEAL